MLTLRSAPAGPVNAWSRMEYGASTELGHGSGLSARAAPFGAVNAANTATTAIRACPCCLVFMTSPSPELAGAGAAAESRRASELTV